MLVYITGMHSSSIFTRGAANDASGVMRGAFDDGPDAKTEDDDNNEHTEQDAPRDNPEAYLAYHRDIARPIIVDGNKLRGVAPDAKMGEVFPIPL